MQGGHNWNPFSGFGNGPHPFMPPSIFTGRDPFDDPFFTQPFGGGAFDPHFFGPGPGLDPFGPARPREFPFSMSRPSPFPFVQPSPFGNLHRPGLGPDFIEQRPQAQTRRGPIIEELSSDDDENEEKEEEEDKNENLVKRKHGRSNLEPFVEYPDEEIEDRGNNHMHSQSNLNQSKNMMTSHMTSSHPQQSHGYSFQSTTVSYGGKNGTYYSSSKMRRTGSDGLTFEESKEADTSTGQASHKVLKGIHNKGHAVSRKLNSDGKVETMQTLHNLNEDELNSFDETWKGRARKHLRGFHEEQYVIGSGSGGGSRAGPSRALEDTERPHHHHHHREVGPTGCCTHNANQRRRH